MYFCSNIITRKKGKREVLLENSPQQIVYRDLFKLMNFFTEIIFKERTFSTDFFFFFFLQNTENMIADHDRGRWNYCYATRLF